MSDLDPLIEATDRQVAAPNYGAKYLLGRRVRLPVACAHDPDHRTEPATRALHIFAIDPAASRLEGKTATAQVSFEPLKPGPIGSLIEVACTGDCPFPEECRPADLDERTLLLTGGRAPSESDHEFHAQMVYAVASQVHASFRRALGRQIGWPFAGVDNHRLKIRPFVRDERNAWYDPNAGSLNFGYYNASERPSDRTLPKGRVFTSLSHDIVAHEMSHAMLDALRSNFVLPTSNDMTGFHEGFADLVALFHHFLHKDALKAAIKNCRGELRRSDYLSKIGQQFGRSVGAAPLRSAVNEDLRYSEELESHAMGEVLIAAVFDAFVTVFNRKTEKYRRLATGGTGELPAGILPELLIDTLTGKAADLAGQFLSILIRAIDYLPPVDVRLGDYLRAIITADFDLVQNDRWGYREALIDAFRKREIYPRDVDSLNEDSLLWKAPRCKEPLPTIEALSFKEIYFQSDPGSPVSVGEQIAQACALGEYAAGNAAVMEELGLVVEGDVRLDGDRVGLPIIESIRTLRRPNPDGRVVFDTVAEILQCRTVQARQGQPGFDLYGGSTLVLDSKGHVRLVVRKSVVGAGRVQRRRDYLASRSGQKFWSSNRKGRHYVLKEASAFRALCADPG